jgi:hypothetical protein
MWRLIILLFAGLFGVPSPAWAQIGFPLGSSPGMLCRQAVAAAERGVFLPPRLLDAVARVESGRRDPASGAWTPWPWTVDAEGQGSFYDTKAQAIAAVLSMQARGIRSIDVGCMQVNLMHHPDAFASLDAAFDPPTNAAWAAHFLSTLFAQTGNWAKAVGLYHSATPELGADYQRRVQAALTGQDGPAGSPLSNAWAATMGSGAPPAGGGMVSAQGMLPPRQVNMLKIMLRPTGAAPGRDLGAYRAMPVGMAVRRWHVQVGG